MSDFSKTIAEWKKSCKFVIWQTCNDDHVCDVCRKLHNKLIPIDEIGEMIPAHEGCRCYIKPVVSYELFAQEIDKIMDTPTPKKKRKFWQ